MARTKIGVCYGDFGGIPKPAAKLLLFFDICKHFGKNFYISMHFSCNALIIKYDFFEGSQRPDFTISEMTKCPVFHRFSLFITVLHFLSPKSFTVYHFFW